MINPFSKANRLGAFGAVAAVSVLAAGLLATRATPTVASTSVDASAAAAPLAIGGFQLTALQWASLTTEPARRIDFDSVVLADGVITTNDDATATVYSPFSGRVTAVQAQLGQTLRKGAALASVLAVEAAQNDSDLAAAMATEATARRQLELARATEQRQHELLLAEAGAQKDWAQSQADMDAAANAQRAAAANLSAVRARARILGETAGRGDGGNGGDGLGHLLAPIAGVVVQRHVVPGEFVNSLAGGGSTPLFTISDLRSVWVLANVGEEDAAGLRVGQALEVSALALPGRTLHARVAWVSAVVDPATHRVAVRAELPNPDEALKPQMAVTVRLFQGRPSEGVAIARSAVVYEGQEAHCYVVVADRTLVARKLHIGRVQGSVVEVNSGLSAGDRVVTRGTLFLDAVAEDANT